jgi:hypothetical protein
MDHIHFGSLHPYDIEPTSLAHLASRFHHRKSVPEASRHASFAPTLRGFFAEYQNHRNFTNF